MLTVFLGYFAIMNPIANTAEFIGLTTNESREERSRIALRAVTITFIFFKYSEKTVGFFGQRGLKIITRMMGLILAVMGTQMFLHGLGGAIDAYLGK